MTFVTAEEVVDALEVVFTESQVEVFTEFPSDESTISEGVYVARFYQEQRTKSVLTMLGSNMYDVVDRLEMYLITGQNNPYVDDYLDAISGFIDNTIFEGYSPREYSVEQVYENSSERYRIIFSLTRQQIT
jgi:hypothetical protein